jgi:hypothetical protein
MIEIILIVLGVMFGTLLYDKNRRVKLVIKEGFNQNYSSADYQPIDYDNNIASIYGYKPDGYDTTPKPTVLTCTSNDGLMGMNRWGDCCGSKILNSGVNGTSNGETATRRLFGGVNPKTLIAPIIPAPITDIENWGTDNYTIHSATNNHRSDELFLSGYTVLGDCIRCAPKICTCNSDTSQTIENFISPFDVSEIRTSRPQILQNYGISTVPEKQTFSTITNGNELIYVEKCRNNGKNNHNIFEVTQDDPSMVYDPRMVNYSDSQRGYIDKLLGQPKFYYDDINASRASNYITRNKIDIYSFGESTGRLKDPTNCDFYGNNNQLAVDEFHNSALLHRTDIMQSLMNKRNGEMWQLRNFPISTNGQRMSGGTSKI